MQVIEGASQKIEQLINNIKKDKRNRNILVLVHEPIKQRGFQNWSMGFQNISDNEPGASSFLKDGKPDHQTPPEKILQLLHSFRKME